MTTTISIRDLKAHWATIEAEVLKGKTIEVTNRGKPSVRLVPPLPKKVAVWDNHLDTAIECKGKSASDTVIESRDSRW